MRGTTKNDAALVKLGNEWQRALYLFIAVAQEEKGLGGSSSEETLDAQVLLHPRSTAFGGIFLILPHLDELPLVEATRDWPHADEAAAISLVRFLVLLKCCGRENSERAFYDPLLRDLLLIPPTLSPEALRTWQAQLKSRAFAKVSGDFIRMAMFPRRDRRKRTAACRQQTSRPSVAGLDRCRSRALVAALTNTYRIGCKK